VAEARNTWLEILLNGLFSNCRRLSKGVRSTLPFAIPKSNSDRPADVAKIATVPASGLGTFSHHSILLQSR